MIYLPRTHPYSEARRFVNMVGLFEWETVKAGTERNGKQWTVSCRYALAFVLSLLLTMDGVSGSEETPTQISDCDHNETCGYWSTEIFPLVRDHVHGSTIVELPNGDLLAAWFQGSGERWADDVVIMGARLQVGEDRWSEPFVVADVPGFPDINPILFIDPENRLWLMWDTVIANQWETSVLKYRISTDYLMSEGPPNWLWQDVLHVKPGDSSGRGIQPRDRFVKSIERQIEEYAEYLSGSSGHGHISSGHSCYQIHL